MCCSCIDCYVLTLSLPLSLERLLRAITVERKDEVRKRVWEKLGKVERHQSVDERGEKHPSCGLFKNS